jgi:hypothetical protein
VVEFANELHQTVKCMEAAVPVITDMHHAPTGWAMPVEHIKFPESEIDILGPCVRHLAGFQARRVPSKATHQLIAVTADFVALL